MRLRIRYGQVVTEGKGLSRKGRNTENLAEGGDLSQNKKINREKEDLA